MVETLLAWIWAPVALYALAFAVGLLAERITHCSVPNQLLAPLGTAVVVSLALTVFRLGGSAAVAVPLLLVAGLAGLVLARGPLLERVNPGVAGLAAIAAYGLYLAPVALSGHWTWGGYNFVNDTSVNFIYANLLAQQGLTSPDPNLSTTAAIASMPEALGYPLGAHALLAALKPLSGAPLAAIYQPVIAFCAGMGALSLAQLARGAGLSKIFAAIAGLLGVAAALTYNYSLHGGIKEILAVALLATAAAFGREALDGRPSVGLSALAGVCAGSLLHVFSAAGVPYLIALAAMLALAALLPRDRVRITDFARAGFVGTAAALLVAGVSLPDIVSFRDVANGTFAASGGASTGEFGHLVRPLPLEQVAGVWLARDYRGPVPPGVEGVNSVLITVVFCGALIGAIVELRRRAPSVSLLFATTAITALVVAPRVSPYADGKLLVMLSPGVVLLAAVGGLALLQNARSLLRAGGAVAILLVATGVFWSDALAYNAVRLAPPDRVEAMVDAAEHARGGGQWLVNEWEEFAKFFMRDIRVNAAAESTSPKSVDLREPAPIFGRYFDLDAQRINYVTQFPGIIKRRSPDASRPPASFDLIYSNAFYEVWRRRPVRVRDHLPLQRVDRATAMPSCSSVRSLAQRAHKGDRLVAAWRPETPMLDTVNSSTRSPGWVPDPANPGVITPLTPGQATASVRTESGRYRVWVRGSSGRPVRALVDGREVGAADEVNTPGQWLQVGELRLRAGLHRLELRRPGGWITPGNGYPGEIGPLALEPVAHPRLLSVAPERAETLCGHLWDWVELVGGEVSS